VLAGSGLDAVVLAAAVLAGRPARGIALAAEPTQPTVPTQHAVPTVPTEVHPRYSDEGEDEGPAAGQEVEHGRSFLLAGRWGVPPPDHGPDFACRVRPRDPLIDIVEDRLSGSPGRGHAPDYAVG
jgi:hypothetical protein